MLEKQNPQTGRSGSSVTQGVLCAHCENPLTEDSPHPEFATAPHFCCMGCQTVYHILHSQGLSYYYEVKQKAASVRAPRPVSSSNEKYTYLDDPDFIKAHSLDGLTMEFYLEGVHCVACLWLIEKLPEIHPDVQNARLDLGKAVARITLKPNGKFSRVAQQLKDLGYLPHPIQKNQDAEALQKKENRSQLIRLGVAASCTGNLMLMAIPLYGGAQGSLAVLFRWVSLGLFLPILFYSATPFYKSSLAAIRSRSISIDIPIVLGLLIGSVASAFNLWRGSEILYFDSLGALVFLLLSSRYVLRRIQQNILSTSYLFQFLAPGTAHKKVSSQSSEILEVRADSLKPGDLIEVWEGEAIPADGILKNSQGFINEALLTGESVARKVVAGEVVYSGTVSQRGNLEIEVTAVGMETRLGKILKEIEKGDLNKAPIVTWADQVSRWFILGVLLIAAGAFLYYLPTSPSTGFARALALVIVTCPCALALATPLAMSVSLMKAARQGMLIKGAETLERLKRAQTLFFDKTGTLTQGSFAVIEWFETEKAPKNLKEAVIALEVRSKHPVAKALTDFLRAKGMVAIPAVENFEEVLGQGVFGEFDRHSYEVRAVLPSDKVPYHFALSGTVVGVWVNKECVAMALLGDKIRSDSKTAIQKIHQMGITPYILSGDNRRVVDVVGDALGIPVNQRMAHASPETKKEVLERFPKSLMVGDGANDAIALAVADVGIAVHGSMEISLRAADVYLSASGVTPVVELLETAQETFKIIRRNFIFSLLYNGVGGAAAVLGMVNPLFAAILMPLSSFTVFASSVYGTRKLRRRKEVSL